MGKLSYLLGRNNPAKTLVDTVDIKPGKKVADTSADELRSKAIGAALLDWWMYGNKYWVFHVPEGPPPGAQIKDLRFEFIKALGKDGRKSYICMALGFTAFEMRSIIKIPQVDEARLGRDLADWMHTSGMHYRCGNLLLATLVNNAWGHYFASVAREKAKGAET